MHKNRSRVAFRNIWNSNDITKEFLEHLTSEAMGEEQSAVITSVFPSSSTVLRKLTKSFNYRVRKRIDVRYNQERLYGLTQPLEKVFGRLNIWYTGENRRLPINTEWDVLMSFENDKFFRNNIYLPFWATRFGSDLQSAKSKQEVFTKDRRPKLGKEKFACAFIGNPEPTRMAFVHELSCYKKVDLFGDAFNNPVQNKLEIMKSYKFNICFENDLYPGYVTEKPFEAWEVESIPIWWGLDKNAHLNPNAIIDIQKSTIKSPLTKSI